MSCPVTYYLSPIACAGWRLMSPCRIGCVFCFIRFHHLNATMAGVAMHCTSLRAHRCARCACSYRLAQEGLFRFKAFTDFDRCKPIGLALCCGGYLLVNGRRRDFAGMFAGCERGSLRSHFVFGLRLDDAFSNQTAQSCVPFSNAWIEAERHEFEGSFLALASRDSKFTWRSQAHR